MSRFSLPRFCLYKLKGWFAFILPFKACSCNCRGTEANACSDTRYTHTPTHAEEIHVRYENLPHESIVVHLWHENVGTLRSEGRDGEKKERWVHLGVILSCPRNFPPNTRKSLSDQQPTSSCASSAEAPHASSGFYPNSLPQSRRCIGWLVYSQMFQAMARQIPWHSWQHCALAMFACDLLLG